MSSDPDDPRIIGDKPPALGDPVYWEKVIICWPAKATRDGDIVKIGTASIEEIIDNGTGNVTGLSDDWQVIN